MKFQINVQKVRAPSGRPLIRILEPGTRLQSEKSVFLLTWEEAIVIHEELGLVLYQTLNRSRRHK